MAQLQFRSDDSALWEEKFGNGSSSSLTISSNTTDSPTNTTCSGTSASTLVTVGSATGFSVGDLVIIHQSRNGSSTAGTWMLNKINNISGTTFTMKYALVSTFDTTAQIQKLPQYSAITINSGSALTGSAWNGSTGGLIAFLCNGTTTIDGTIAINGGNGSTGSSTASIGSGGGYRASAGANAAISNQGEGTGGAGSASTSANGSGGGGGGNAAAGGGGGNASSGNNATGFGTLGTGGSSSGDAGLITMTFGGGGAGGSTGGNGGWTVGAGGNGGGIVLIFTKNLSVGASGAITVNGGSGGAPNSGSGQASGGGGAGGSILLKAQTATLGSSRLLASAGVGGSNGFRSGGNGSVGRIHLDYLTSFSGTTSPALDSRQDSSLTLSGGSGSGGAGFLFGMI